MAKASDSQIVSVDGHRLQDLQPRQGALPGDRARRRPTSSATTPRSRRCCSPTRSSARPPASAGCTESAPRMRRVRCSSRRTSTPARRTGCPRADIAHSDHDNTYPLVEQRGGARLAGADRRARDPRAAVALHRTTAQRRNPDRLVLDLDPGDGHRTRRSAPRSPVSPARILTGMGLDPMPVTSGSKGIHLYAQLDERQTSDQVSAVARELARVLEADHPDLVVSDMKKTLRTRQGARRLEPEQRRRRPRSRRTRCAGASARPSRRRAPGRSSTRPSSRHLEYDEVLGTGARSTATLLGEHRHRRRAGSRCGDRATSAPPRPRHPAATASSATGRSGTRRRRPSRFRMPRHAAPTAAASSSRSTTPAACTTTSASNATACS